MNVRVLVVPKDPPGYVSVVLDSRSERGGKISTLHSFGSFSFEALARAEHFRLTCELAMRLFRTAITAQDQQILFRVFAGSLGISTLERLFRASNHRRSPQLSPKL